MQHDTSIGMAKGEAIRVVKARLEEAGITLPEPTYRLINAPQTGAVADTVQQAAPQTPVEVQEVGTEEADALGDIIEAERDALPDDDLLRREAPQE